MPLIILLLVATASIFNAVLAIRPAATHGEFTEEEIRKKKGNILDDGYGDSLSSVSFSSFQS